MLPDLVLLQHLGSFSGNMGMDNIHSKIEPRDNVNSLRFFCSGIWTDNLTSSNASDTAGIQYTKELH